MMLLTVFLAMLLVSTAQGAPPVLGCTPLTDPNPYCLAEVCIDASCFGPTLQMTITDSTTTVGSSVSQTIGGQNSCFQYRVTRTRTLVSVTLQEGVTQFTTTLPINVIADQGIGLSQTITNHIALLNINLQNYDPAGVSNQLPSFTGNTWGVKLFTVDNTLQKRVFREYRDIAGNPNCTFNNVLPLDHLTKGVALPTNNPFQVCVLPWADVQVRVSENLNPTCPSEGGAVFVDCHFVNNVPIGQLFDKDCSVAGNRTCNSGLCVTQLAIPAVCDWISTVPSYTGTQFGLAAGSGGFNITIQWQPLLALENTRYRQIPNLPFGFYYTPTVLAVDNYSANSLFPSGASTPTALSPRATNCASTIQCELLALASILKLDVGSNSANITVAQGPQTTVNIVNANGTPHMCVLNYLACPTVTYAGPVAVTLPACAECETVTQYCELGPYWRWLNPDYDCFLGGIGLDSNSYPDNLKLEVVAPNGNVNWVRVVPNSYFPIHTPIFPACASISPLFCDDITHFQVPNIDGLRFRASEGLCPGLPVNPLFATCASFSTPVIPVPPALFTDNGPLITATIGRVLSAFELFYLDVDNVDVTLYNTNNEAFRHRADQGGVPRCYCVLPIVLRVGISENAACWRSTDISCVVDWTPTADEDCEVCDFLSILRFDLRGLPPATSGILRAGPRDARQDLLIWQRFETPVPYDGTRPREGVWTPLSPRIFDQGQPSGLLPNMPPASTFPPPSNSATGRTAAIFGNSNINNTLRFTFQLPAYTNQIDLSFWAWPLGYTVAPNPPPTPSAGGSVSVVGSVSGTLLSARVIDTTNGVWTLNARNALGPTVGLETITVTFTGYGFNNAVTPLIDEVKVTGYSKPVDFVRELNWIGDTYNNITVLRNGFQECYQRYCLEVFDNGASLELCTECVGKDCEFKPFTRVLCLNLTNACGPQPQCLGYVDIYKKRDFVPNLLRDDITFTYYDFCGYDIDNRLQVDIYLHGGNRPIRTVQRQGGVDGCNVRPLYPGGPLRSPYWWDRSRSIAGDSSNKNSVRAGNVNYQHHGFTLPGSYWRGNGWYTVLRLDYDVKISEFTVSVTVPHVDCRDFEGTPGCSVHTGIVGDLWVDTECEGVGPLPNSGDSQQWLNYSQHGTDIVLRDANGVQFRGQRGKIYYPNCTTARWDWSSATCRDCGYRHQCFSVLDQRLKVTVMELPYTGRPMMYPDNRTYPRVTVDVDCTSGTCATILGQLYSYLQVYSERGYPSRECQYLSGGPCNFDVPFNPLAPPAYWPYMVVKFGNVVQTPIRVIPEEFLYPGCYAPVDKRSPPVVDCHTPNKICVLADPSPEYAINWGYSWASDGSGRTFSDCASLTNDIDNCRNPDIIVVPAWKKRDTENKPVISRLMEEVAAETGRRQ